MKKSTKALIIISVVLLLIGGSMIFYALSQAQFDWDRLTVYTQNETFEYPVSEAVNDLSIQTKQVDVRVMRATDNICLVRCKTASVTDCSVETSDGALSIICARNQSVPWYQKIWRTDDSCVTVYLPKDEYENLTIKTGSGDVFVSEEVSFVSVSLKTGSGDVENYAPVRDRLSVSSGSGNITVKRCVCDSISLVCESGTVTCENCRNDTLNVKTSSGDMAFSICHVKNMQTYTASGEISFEQIDVKELLDVSTSSGDVLYNDSTVGSLQIISKSGDITGTMIEPMLFDVRTDSGDVRVPASEGIKRCAIRTGSGDVDLKMAESSDSD